MMVSMRACWNWCWIAWMHPSPASEHTLEQELQASQLLDLYGTSLLRFAYSYARNMADAQEIVQDTLVQYFLKQPVCPSENQRKAWLMQVCANLSKNRLRFNKRRAAVSLDLLSEPGVLQEDLSYVWQAVGQLPPKYREVIHLFYEEGYSTAEIARILRQKESTTRSQLNRARQQLRTMISEDFDDEPV